jgi:hypothetical protein
LRKRIAAEEQQRKEEPESLQHIDFVFDSGRTDSRL